MDGREGSFCPQVGRNPDWNRVHVVTMQEELEPGDLIEVFRQCYTHWALYVGGGNVIHLTVPDGASGVAHSSVPSVHAKKGLVKKEPLSRVVGKDSYHVSKKYDEKYNRRPRKEILRDAEAMVGTWVEYDLFASNCEHFATGICHGVRRSKQAENGLAATTAIGAGLGILAIASFAVAIFDTRKTQQRRQNENSKNGRS
ncbi:hypothetical protein lerEdw1_010915 [Lerista edwardsae]|nr:hypothetical protein lerEdw1_010915 [Lerista edwardsae]